jgi:hypothetical protein
MLHKKILDQNFTFNPKWKFIFSLNAHRIKNVSFNNSKDSGKYTVHFPIYCLH